MLAQHILRRIAVSIPTFIAATTITFLIMHVAAGSYIPGLDLNPNLTAAQVQQLKSYLGLDRPLYVQFASYLWGVLHGDLGRSFRSDRPVADMSAQP